MARDAHRAKGVSKHGSPAKGQQKRGAANDKSHRVGSVWLMYVLVVFFAVVVICSMGYILNTGSRMAAKHTPLIDATMEIRLETAQAHLWLEEMISGERAMDINEIWKLQYSAEWYAQAMLTGGKSAEGVFIPLEDVKLRREIQTLVAKLAEFRDIAVKRYETPQDSPLNSEIERRYHNVFAEVMTMADQVETELQRVIRADLRKFRIVQIVLIIVCATLAVLVGISFGRFIRERIKNEQQLRAAIQQLQASDQQLRAANQQLKANEEELRRFNLDLGERVKELNCLYGLSRLVEQPDITLEQIFEGLAELIPPAWQYPDITRAQVVFEGRRFKTPNFKKTNWVQSADVKVLGKKAGTIEIYYGRKMPELDEGPFLTEERNLINSLAERLGKVIEHKRAEEERRAANQQLRAANQQLIASEQQLKAAIQQLQASGQQLKTANQQLMAGEQQLRAANQQLQADVAERTHAEERIAASLREKEVLLKEIHHRVKNNMQIISSILSLQSGLIKNRHTLKVFADSQNRIRSMALVHEKLYESKDLARIDFAEYVRSMTGYLLSLHGIGNGIRFRIDIKDILLDVNAAIPCGLIINELVSNSLKHAFPKGRKGQIYIGLRSAEAGKLTLTVKDDGVGLPKGLDFKKTKSLGMQLIIMLTEQLGGSIEVDTKKGATFKITFAGPNNNQGGE